MVRGWLRLVVIQLVGIFVCGIERDQEDGNTQDGIHDRQNEYTFDDEGHDSGEDSGEELGQEVERFGSRLIDLLLGCLVHAGQKA